MLEELAKALEKSWCKRTCAKTGLWRRDNPSWGQCAVTAAVVQDYMGGKIVWCMVRPPGKKSASHYFNNIHKAELDFTREQFPEGSKFERGQRRSQGLRTTRKYIMSSDATRKRYELLKERVEAELARARKS
ncbi:hypothetical protein CMO91_02040 [Candidatus Woesearchaeota archaeon]|nr:hypothetical protein [Candidatus Woesearchaeota archaeon]